MSKILKTKRFIKKRLVLLMGGILSCFLFLIVDYPFHIETSPFKRGEIAYIIVPEKNVYQKELLLPYGNSSFFCENGICTAYLGIPRAKNLPFYIIGAVYRWHKIPFPKLFIKKIEKTEVKEWYLEDDNDLLYYEDKKRKLNVIWQKKYQVADSFNKKVEWQNWVIPVEEGKLVADTDLKVFINDIYRGFHEGADILAWTGTPVRAIQNGQVLWIGEFDYYGKTVIIAHGQNITSIYCHLNKITVQKKNNVKSGDVIGTVGSTGTVLAPHLHLEILVGEILVSPENLLLRM